MKILLWFSFVDDGTINTWVLQLIPPTHQPLSFWLEKRCRRTNTQHMAGGWLLMRNLRSVFFFNRWKNSFHFPRNMVDIHHHLEIWPTNSRSFRQYTKNHNQWNWQYDDGNAIISKKKDTRFSCSPFCLPYKKNSCTTSLHVAPGNQKQKNLHLFTIFREKVNRFF